MDPTTLVDEVTIQVAGSISGPRTGRLRLSDDERTILFLPHDRYAPGESVTCVIASGIRTSSGGELPGAEFTFRIAPAADLAPATSLEAFDEDFEFERTRVPLPAVPLDRGRALRAPGASTDTLPSDFPAIQATVTGTPFASAERRVARSSTDAPDTSTTCSGSVRAITRSAMPTGSVTSR